MIRTGRASFAQLASNEWWLRMSPVSRKDAPSACLHEWRYFVTIEGGSVRSKRCVFCGVQCAVGLTPEALPVAADCGDALPTFAGSAFDEELRHADLAG